MRTSPAMGSRSRADGTMSLETTCKVLLALFVATASACVSTELSTGAEHPANPRAPAQPPPPASSALQPNFEPFAAYGVAQGSEAPDHDHGAHSHAEDTDGAPPAPATGSSATPHVAEPAEAVPPSAPPADHTSLPPPSVPEVNGSKRASPPQKKKAKKPEYTCPMHPEVRSPDPGRCPKCGMPLVLEKQKAP